MTDSRRVFVRGVGAVSPIGASVEEIWDRLVRGDYPERVAPESERGIPTPKSAATVDVFREELDALVSSRSLRRVSQLSRYCVAAAGMAKPSEELVNTDDTAVVLGTCFGSSRYHFDYYEKLFSGGIRDASPLLFSECVMNAVSGHVSLHYGLRGASLALVGGEEVGLTAIVDATERIRSGEAVAAFAGGADEYCDFVHAALASRSFVGDTGPCVGEGAAILYLDGSSSDAALAEVVSGAIARGGRRGAEAAVRQAIRRAFRSASIEPKDIELVVTNLPGQDTEDGLDGAQLFATIADELGERDGSLLVTSPSPAVGDGFAFVSGFQAFVAAMSLASEMVPGIGEPSCEVPEGWLADREARPYPARHALVVSLTRRGTAVALLLSRAR